MVEVFDIAFCIFIGALCLIAIILVSVMIYVAIYDHPNLENCKPLNNETSICYYSSSNNSTKVTTKIIPNMQAVS